MNKFDPLIIKYANEFYVSPAQIKGHIKVESDFDPCVIGSAGEKGLMQIMDSTARDMGYDPDKEDSLDPETNIKYGAKYIGWLHGQLWSNKDKVIAAYNWGIGNVKSGKPWPLSVQLYVWKVKYYMLWYGEIESRNKWTG